MPETKSLDPGRRRAIVQKVQDMHMEREVRRSEGVVEEDEEEQPHEEQGQKEPRHRWVQTTRADLFFGGWIILNATVLALETDMRTEENEHSIVWFIGDTVFNTVFLVELALRVEAERSRWICSLWNIFDAVLVAVSIWDSWMMRILGLNGELRFATLLRLFRLMRLVRILRVLRLVRFLKELMLLISGIKQAMLSMLWGLLLLCMAIFIMSLLLTRLVGRNCCDPDDAFQDEMYPDLFGSMFRSAFTLFQFTMEFQPDICRDSWKDGFLLTLALIIYSGFSSITLLNMLASVIVENIMTISNESKERKEAEREAMRQEQLVLKLDQFFRDDESSNRDSVFTLNDMTNDNKTTEMMTLFGQDHLQAEYLFHILDQDGSGGVSRNEFRERLLRVGMEVEMLDFIKVEHQILMLDKFFDDKKAEFEDEQKENLNLLCKLESKQQGFKNVMRCGPGAIRKETRAPMADASRPRVASANDEPPLILESPKGALEEGSEALPAEFVGHVGAGAWKLEDSDDGENFLV